LSANILLECNGQSRLPWGGGPLVGSGQRRAAYIEALKGADQRDFDDLVAFACTA
jgi:hypothetical protein